MLVGQFTHKIDDKGRVSLPAKFRKEIGKTVVMTYGLDKCLFVYTNKEWKEFASKLNNLSMGQADTRAFSRFMLGGATEIDVDTNGRILIPDFLRSYASLDVQMIILGVHSRLEIWSESNWNSYIKLATKKADQLAEKLGEIGMI